MRQKSYDTPLSKRDAAALHVPVGALLYPLVYLLYQISYVSFSHFQTALFRTGHTF